MNQNPSLEGCDPFYSPYKPGDLGYQEAEKKEKSIAISFTSIEQFRNNETQRQTLRRISEILRAGLACGIPRDERAQSANGRQLLSLHRQRPIAGRNLRGLRPCEAGDSITYVAGKQEYCERYCRPGEDSSRNSWKACA